MSVHVKVSDKDGIRSEQMLRVEKKNALSKDMYIALTEALNSLHTANDIRCVVLSGVPDAFCAGNDLEDFLNAAQSGEAGIRWPVEFLEALVRCPRPIVAAVDGLAIGIGTTMLLHCDYVIAADNARFATPFVSLGLVPEGGSSLIMPRLMGYQRAFAMLAMGLPMTAAQAQAAGFVNVVCTSAELSGEAEKAAQHIATLPAAAVAQTRTLLRGSPEDICERINDEADLFARRMRSPEAVAAFTAFLARKRN